MLQPSEIHPGIGTRRGAMEPTHQPVKGKSLKHPAPLAPKIFADTAKIEEIRTLRDGGIITGVTTNPTLLKAAGAHDWDSAHQIMRDIVKLMAPHPVSLEITELDPVKMVEQGKRLAGFGPNVVVKVATGGYQAVDKALDPFTGLHVIHELWKADIRTNATLIFNCTQALWAANAGATYVSPFLGRLADYMYKNDTPERAPGNSLFFMEDHKAPAGGPERVGNTPYVALHGPRMDAGVRLINEIVTVFCNYNIHTEVLAASLRNAVQLSECLVAGADIITVPAAILMGVADHTLTSEGMTSFVKDTQVFGHQ
ncbi:MAG: hypothetical protein OEW12_05890 [Deltaproteobacteria bacterium]|nr:hypothetical protein [Deltaproteobacteria bacterium]